MGAGGIPANVGKGGWYTATGMEKTLYKKSQIRNR
jgi:hypothetical protein